MANITDLNIDFQVDGQPISMATLSRQFEFFAEGTLCMSIAVFDDSLLEFDEYFSFSFNQTDFSPSGVVLDAGRSVSTVTILDDEGKERCTVCGNR